MLTAGFATRAQITHADSVVNPSCFGYGDGHISTALSGGTEPYTVIWYFEGGVFEVNSLSLDSLVSGDYILHITDSAGLAAVDTITLTDPYQITTIDTISDASCYGVAGGFNITPQGGIEFYQGIWQRYIWVPDSNQWLIDLNWVDTMYTNADTSNFEAGYTAGVYLLTITDSLGLGCSVVRELEIHEPSSPLTFHETHEHNICKNGEAGWITVAVDGGTSPYIVEWSNSQAGVHIEQLPAGAYTVTVTDGNNCRVYETIDIEEPFQDIILHIDYQDVTCRDNKDGYVTVESVENAALPWAFQWSDQTAGEGISDLSEGTYSVTITDANNCQYSDSVELKLMDIDCIIINNVITPDGNDKNDTWIIENIHLYPNCDVSVFDRWGNQVYYAGPGYDNSWDATQNGALLDSGDYYYVVNLNIGNYRPYTGPLKVLK